MIRRLSGTVIASHETSIVLEVGGVGYLITTCSPGLTYTPQDAATIWTHQAVRETALELYGFATEVELAMFELLLTLPKIGPKSAASIMSNADVTLLTQAISEEDATYLSKMSGIGAKTAEKIVQGLKDKLPTGAVATTEAGAAAPAWQQEAVDALVSLGYPHKAARDAVRNLPAEVATTTEAVKLALKELSA